VQETKAEIIVENNLPYITADRFQITLLFQNLISNAIKFRNNHSPKIHIRGEDNKTHWQFSVKDNGIGIDEEQSKDVFRIFYRLHTREEYPGTGLGLALCKKIVEHHGGNIWLKSETGKGST